VCKQDRRIVEPNSKAAAKLQYISLEHVESNTGRILRQPADRVDDEGKSTTFAFDSRHVLYGKLRPYLNKVALPEFAGRCTTEIIPLLPKAGVDREFLCRLLRRAETVEAAMRDKTGSRMLRADMDELMRLEIPLPPLAEQKRIAGILKEQMAAVERALASAEAQLQAAENLTPAYFREAFHTITPLAAGVERDNPPSGWKWRKLTDIARLESGHTPSRYHPEWWGGKIPWLALPDIRALDGKVAHETLEYTNENGIANSSARILPAGTVVLSRTASVGFVTIMGRAMATSQDFVNWVCAPALDSSFLAFLLRASRYYFLSLASGAVHKTVYMPTLKALDVCIPPLADQRRIAARLSSQMASSERLRQMLTDQLDAIDKLPAALLRRAFNGEL
jgi:type I restriction enzyme S subunit